MHIRQKSLRKVLLITVYTGMPTHFLMMKQSLKSWQMPAPAAGMLFIVRQRHFLLQGSAENQRMTMFPLQILLNLHVIKSRKRLPNSPLHWQKPKRPWSVAPALDLRLWPARPVKAGTALTRSIVSSAMFLKDLQQRKVHSATTRCSCSSLPELPVIRRLPHTTINILSDIS